MSGQRPAEGVIYFTAQVMFFCILAGIGMVFAGNYLEIAHVESPLK